MSKTVKWLIEQLEKELGNFDDETRSLISAQEEKFELCKQLLEEDSATLAAKSYQTQRKRIRARSTLGDIFHGLGSEVFVLCALAASVTNLGSLTQRGLIPELRKWWQSTPHPNGLAEVAEELCEKNSIRTLMSSSRKRGISEVTTTGILHPFTLCSMKC